MGFLGLTIGQFLMLTGFGVALLVILFVLKVVLKLTRTCLGLGCLGIVVLLVVAFVALQAATG